MKGKKFYIQLSCIVSFLLVLSFFYYFQATTSSKHKKNAILFDVSFDESLGVRKIGKNYIIGSPQDKSSYEVMKKLWKKNLEEKNCTNTELKIPKIIHQIIAFQPDNIKNEKKYIQSWKTMHPSWEIMVWNEEDFSKLSPEVTDLLMLMQNSKEKLDLVRCAILEKFGGVCVGSEFECLRSLDDLHHKFHFYSGLESPYLKRVEGRVLHISSQLIGAIPNHPILQNWYNNMRQYVKEKRVTSSSLHEKKESMNFMLTDAVETSGFLSPFINIVFPPTYAYPVSPRWIRKFHRVKKKGHKKIKLKNAADIFFLKDKVPLFSKIRTESFAINHLGGSWEWNKKPKSFKKMKCKKKERSQITDL